MFTAWMIMLFSGNLGHHLSNPKWFVGYLMVLPLGILLDGTAVIRIVSSRRSDD